jgi:hypothetical protein
MNEITPDAGGHTKHIKSLNLIRSIFLRTSECWRRRGMLKAPSPGQEWIA